MKMGTLNTVEVHEMSKLKERVCMFVCVWV